MCGQAQTWRDQTVRAAPCAIHTENNTTTVTNSSSLLIQTATPFCTIKNKINMWTWTCRNALEETSSATPDRLTRATHHADSHTLTTNQRYILITHLITSEQPKHCINWDSSRQMICDYLKTVLEIRSEQIPPQHQLWLTSTLNSCQILTWR